eukprot:TRINITY_DN5714_c0_g1_i1.p2 TRINITY_DN5714_c0_g1~~TRINITY_DN5714_c0_g1_i1.p2  ORF type:complete len:55 (-),score=8.78 TRINITY_DN5714_c0_g1_i1:204-368(-)
MEKCTHRCDWKEPKSLERVLPAKNGRRRCDIGKKVIWRRCSIPGSWKYQFYISI